MFSEYLKLTLNKKNTFSFIKLNLFPASLEVLLFFILPILIKKYYIIGQYEAIALNSIFLFLFEASIVFISRSVLRIEKKECRTKIFFNAAVFAFIKTDSFLFFFYLFKKAMSLTFYLAFILCFFSMFIFLCLFWLPSLLVKNNFASSCKKSIQAYFSYPFFTTFVFLHSTLLFFISLLLLNVYPGISKIIYNMHEALWKMEEKSGRIL